MVFAYLVTMVRSSHYQVLSSQIRLLGGALSFLAVMVGGSLSQTYGCQTSVTCLSSQVYTWYVLSARQWVEHTATDSHAYIAVLPVSLVISSWLLVGKKTFFSTTVKIAGAEKPGVRG